jgi:hypothetical protein
MQQTLDRVDIWSFVVPIQKETTREIELVNQSTHALSSLIKEELQKLHSGDCMDWPDGQPN